MTSTSFPDHGPISCRRCFNGSPSDVATFGRWQAVNDPAAEYARIQTAVDSLDRDEAHARPRRRLADVAGVVGRRTCRA